MLDWTEFNWSFSPSVSLFFLYSFSFSLQAKLVLLVYDSSCSIIEIQVFIKEYEEIRDRINQELEILGDKDYVGLEKENVQTSKRKVFKYP